METCRWIHCQLDEFVLGNGLLVDSCVQNDWETQFNEHLQGYKLDIKNRMNMNQKSLFHELQSSEAQEEVLTLLLFESDNRASKYTEQEMDMMHKVFQHVSSLSKLGIPSVPSWFVPPQDVDIRKQIAKGAYGSVHLGRWNGATVVVKCAFLTDPQAREMFMREVDIWHKLQHPNIIQLYKACHVGNPFFVCEMAENGTLSDFLFKNGDPAIVWQKLLEAARGLLYLHEVHKVMHGDLKGDNILVCISQSSGNGLAKLTDFGLSSKVSSGTRDLNTEEVGAIQWKAPEVIQDRKNGSLASDVYSFGMCMLEAVKGGLPWGNFADTTVKHKLKAKMLPNQPDQVNDAQWELISQMCAWEPSDRPGMKQVVDSLEAIVRQQ